MQATNIQEHITTDNTCIDVSASFTKTNKPVNKVKIIPLPHSRWQLRDQHNQTNLRKSATFPSTTPSNTRQDRTTTNTHYCQYLWHAASHHGITKQAKSGASLHCYALNTILLWQINTCYGRRSDTLSIFCASSSFRSSCLISLSEFHLSTQICLFQVLPSTWLLHTMILIILYTITIFCVYLYIYFLLHLL